VTEQAL